MISRPYVGQRIRINDPTSRVNGMTGEITVVDGTYITVVWDAFTLPNGVHQEGFMQSWLNAFSDIFAPALDPIDVLIEEVD